MNVFTLVKERTFQLQEVPKAEMALLHRLRTKRIIGVPVLWALDEGVWPLPTPDCRILIEVDPETMEPLFGEGEDV